MREVIITLLFAVLVVLGCPDWLATQEVPYWTRAMVYPFFHANIFHLALNCLCIWTMFHPRFKDRWRVLILGYLISVLVYGLSIHPVIGISNILFAIVGMRTPPFTHKWWRSKNALIFLGVNLLMVFVPKISAVTHIASFIIGVIIAHIHRWSGR